MLVRFSGCTSQPQSATKKIVTRLGCAGLLEGARANGIAEEAESDGPIAKVDSDDLMEDAIAYVEYHAWEGGIA